VGPGAVNAGTCSALAMTERSDVSVDAGTFPDPEPPPELVHAARASAPVAAKAAALNVRRLLPARCGLGGRALLCMSSSGALLWYATPVDRRWEIRLRPTLMSTI
jgi:hypothetical protein